MAQRVRRVLAHACGGNYVQVMLEGPEAHLVQVAPVEYLDVARLCGSAQLVWPDAAVHAVRWGPADPRLAPKARGQLRGLALFLGQQSLL